MGRVEKTALRSLKCIFWAKSIARRRWYTVAQWIVFNDCVCVPVHKYPSHNSRASTHSQYSSHNYCCQMFLQNIPNKSNRFFFFSIIVSIFSFSICWCICFALQIFIFLSQRSCTRKRQQQQHQQQVTVLFPPSTCVFLLFFLLLFCLSFFFLVLHVVCTTHLNIHTFFPLLLHTDKNSLNRTHTHSVESKKKIQN